MKKRISLILSVLMLFMSLGSTYVASAANPGTISVSTIGDLLSIADNPSGTYNLVNDINASDFNTSIPEFYGTFNGNGYQIMLGSSPLFTVVEKGAVVQNLSVVSSSVSGETNIGILAGTSYGTIKNCAAIGSVNAVSAAGGLVGFVSEGTVSDCYSVGSVSASGSTVGGLVGKAENAVIERSYSIAYVSGTSVEAGGLIGANIGSTITNCYASSEYSGQLLGVGIGSDSVINKNKNEMKSAQSFNGFNFNTTWTIIEGEITPRLIAINGKGTAETPYRIHGGIYDDYNDLNDFIPSGLGSSGIGKNFRLESDFSNYFPYCFGNNENRFNGVFDGNNHVFREVSGVFNGLFEAVGENGIVKNLVFANCNTENVDVFGFVANVNYGTIENCHIFNVNITGQKDLAGIAGENINGTIRRCSFSGVVYGYHSGIGGIVGYNSYGTISECSVKDGSVIAKDHSSGGIVGDNTSGIVENCMNYGVLVKGYGGEAGGIAGRLYNGTLKNCYANQETTIVGENVCGSIAGAIIENGIIENCYYNSEKTAVGVGSTQDTNGALINTTVKNTNKFEGFDFNNTWTTDEDGDLALISIKGAGTAQNPYIIRYGNDWTDAGDGIGPDGLRDYYKLNNNINATENIEFSGSLNGNGYTITLKDCLLGKLKPGGYIGNVIFYEYYGDRVIENAENATIEYCSLIGGNSAGMIGVAQNTKIRNCGVTVNTDLALGGENDISGGLVGQASNGTTIDNCYVRGAVVKGSSFAGGLIGNNSGGKITNCYVYDSTVTSNNTAGGFAGRNDNGGTIENCYTNASAAGTTYSGAFVGMNYASISNIFADDSVLKTVAAQNEGTISGESLSSEGAVMPRPYIQAGGLSMAVNDTTVYTPVTTIKSNSGLTDIYGHWAEKTIENLVSLGIVNGYEDNTYRPEDSVTKGEYIKLLMSVTSSGTSTNFTQYRDVNASWARGYVSRAIELGLCDYINSGDTEFGVDEPITRTQAAALMGRLLPTDSDGALNFTDTASIPDWAQGPVYASVQRGLIAGNDDGSFKPLNNLTRAEAATIIERILNLE